LAFVGVNAVAADDTKADAKPTAPLLADILESSGITATGYVDGTYSYLSQSPAAAPTQDTNSFALNQASLTVAYTPPKDFGVLVNAVAGTEACDGCYAPGYGSSGAHAGTSSINLLQAYVQYVTGKTTILGGKFVTLAGAEGSAPTGNTNVTRSLIWWYSEPTTHVGARVIYAASDQATFTFGVNNGWNNDGSVPGGGKTAELAMSLSPSKSFTFSAAAYYGAFDLGSGLVGNRTLFDVVGTWSPTSALTVVLNADWDQQDHARGPGTGPASWYGIAGYLNYAIDPTWRTSLRLEYLDDQDGLIFGASSKVDEGTLTLGYMPAKRFELRLEARYDTIKPDGAGSSNVAQAWLQALYKF
jgi:Putative beta-barrel porin-2, OmpL-like. bbp2